jgi:predicted nucleic acid-binding protein
MILLDTGPLVAALDNGDEWHAWAVGKMKELRGPVWTCGAVLSEATFLVGQYRPALVRISTLLRGGAIRAAEEGIDVWRHAAALMERYTNVPMSFADACLVAMAERAPVTKIFTLDRDFLIYRRSDGQPLSLISPFAESAS